MATLPGKKSSAGESSSTITFTFFGHIWNGIGNYLKREQQIRKNNEAYTLLLESDDYILRDIGISRADIRKRRDQYK